MNFPAALMRCVWKSASDSAVNPPACRPLRGWGKGALSWKEAALQVPRRAAPKGGPFLPVGQAPPPPRPPGPGPGKRNVIWVLPPLFLTAGHLCGMCEVCHRQSSRGEHRQPTSTHRTDRGSAACTSQSNSCSFKSLHGDTRVSVPNTTLLFYFPHLLFKEKKTQFRFSIRNRQ